MCVDCGLKTSATAGTIFHRSHTPLSTWFAAIWFVTPQKNGVSAQDLQDALGFGSYETAWVDPFGVGGFDLAVQPGEFGSEQFVVEDSCGERRGCVPWCAAGPAAAVLV